jgi:hydrogenase maturation protein HypF
MNVRRRIEVSGIVQGVGFRPYVYRLAGEHSLAGHILNTPAGVTIELQGPAASVDEFLKRLPAEAPPLAHITGILVQEIPNSREDGFEILSSERDESVRTLISPDVAVCDDCLRELFDPSDRRYLYPFINCTNCGPRFTIVRSIPYDRALTSMAGFRMCADCQAEYDDPRNRRFHAQPNACWKCGPRVELWNRDGKTIPAHDSMASTVALLDGGKIVAIKGLGGFHLAADATNQSAVELLRTRKLRVEKPFAVMVPDVAAAEAFCEVDAAARRALEGPQRPIVLLHRKPRCLIAEQVAPHNRELGLFLPYTPLHHLLFAKGNFRALVMTSANRSEEPIAIDNREAVERLHDLADFLLVHNRDILWRCDDSVVRPAASKIRQLRRSRGYVPVPMFLHEDLPPILAVGGELKNTICLAKGRHAFMSQHIGDLENLESYGFFQDVIEHFERILEIGPRVIAHDLHPDYLSTKWALAQKGVCLVGVQHHHAHIASCMAENHLEGRLIGFSLDGTGYGTDGQIWGGEVLLADYIGFERTAHFDYVPMPGGAKAIQEPWRMAVAYLAHHWGREFLSLPIPFVRQLDKREVGTILQMLARKVNSPMTSSCGRLFDAVAALVGLRTHVNYEGQAAIELEAAIGGSTDATPYPIELRAEGNTWIFDTLQLFERLFEDLRRQVPVGTISRRFHNGLVEAFVQLAVMLRDQHALERVCMSGGTFQNVFLAENLCSRLETLGFKVFTQAEVPPGDGGLSLGQIMVAAHTHYVEHRSEK